MPIYIDLYGFNRDEAIYIINAFHSLKAVELRKFGEYKTFRFVLSYFDMLDMS